MTPNLRMIPHRIGFDLAQYRIRKTRRFAGHVHSPLARRTRRQQKVRLQNDRQPKENARPWQVGRFSILRMLPLETECRFLERQVSSSDRPAE